MARAGCGTKRRVGVKAAGTSVEKGLMINMRVIGCPCAVSAVWTRVPPWPWGWEPVTAPLEDAMECDAPSCSVTARPPQPGLDLERPPVSPEQSKDGENSKSSSPNRNILILPFIATYNVILQRTVALTETERATFKPQRVSSARRDKTSQVKHSLELI